MLSSSVDESTTSGDQSLGVENINGSDASNDNSGNLNQDLNSIHTENYSIQMKRSQEDMNSRAIINSMEKCRSKNSSQHHRQELKSKPGKSSNKDLPNIANDDEGVPYAALEVDPLDALREKIESEMKIRMERMEAKRRVEQQALCNTISIERGELERRIHALQGECEALKNMTGQMSVPVAVNSFSESLGCDANTGPWKNSALHVLQMF